MDLGLDGRRAAVAAASDGLGFATAQGVRVVICGRDRGRIEAAAKRIGDAAVPLVADVGTPDGASGFVEAARETLGAIDILVANGGGPPPGMARDTDLETLRHSVDACTFSLIAMCQAALPGMRERGWGRILAITTVGVRQPLANMVYSNTARAGLTGYLKTLAREVSRDGVTVNSLLPGAQLTDRLRSLVGEGLDQMAGSLIAGRLGDPADFGQVAAFLCSAPANYVNGVALAIDGAQDGSLA